MARVAVVTGAAQGIGRRVAEVLAERGYAVVLSDLLEPVEALQSVRERGGAALSVVGDVSSERYAGELSERTLGEFGRIDVLVNNAGVSLLVPAEQTTAEQWRRVLDVMLMTMPPPCRFIAGRLSFTRWSGATTLQRSICSMSSIGVSSNGSMCPGPM